MRIIGGALRGRQIILPTGFKARPTTDFAREGLFNVLTNSIDLESISVLDLFSGTGCISYEFLSRGCKDITSVEMDSANARFIKTTSGKLAQTFSKSTTGAQPVTEPGAIRNSESGAVRNSESGAIHTSESLPVIKSVHHNVFDFLKICNKNFDIIFADPPYDMDGFQLIPNKIFDAQLFKDKDSILIFEHPSKFSFESHPAFIKEKKYGNVHFSFFSAKNIYLQNEDNKKAGMAQDKD